MLPPEPEIWAPVPQM